MLDATNPESKVPKHMSLKEKKEYGSRTQANMGSRPGGSPRKKTCTTTHGKLASKTEFIVYSVELNEIVKNILIRDTLEYLFSFQSLSSPPSSFPDSF